MIYTVVDQIRDELKRRVMSGDLRLGSRIFEDGIAAEFKVSRSAVREAVRLLEQEGLVVREAHRGLYVASPSYRDACDAAQLRAVLEAEAVRLSPPPGAGIVEELESMCREFARLEGGAEHIGAVDLDRTFHTLIAQGSRNEMLLRKYHELDGPIAIFFHWFMAKVPSRIVGIADRHRLLVRAFALGDPGIYALAVEEHYTQAVADLARDLPESARAAREPMRRVT